MSSQLTRRGVNAGVVTASPVVRRYPGFLLP